MLPTKLKAEMADAIIQAGYGMRGKSKWIAESVEALRGMDDYHNYVAYCCEIKNFPETETATLPKNLKDEIHKDSLVIRKQHPELEGIKSGIIRAAIMQRLLRGEGPFKKR